MNAWFYAVDDCVLVLSVIITVLCRLHIIHYLDFLEVEKIAGDAVEISAACGSGAVSKWVTV